MGVFLETKRLILNIPEYTDFENFVTSITICKKLSVDLQKGMNIESGFSPRNLWDMRRFYMEYQYYPKLRQLVAEILWSHNCF